VQTAQPGDRVQVHYLIRFQDGSVASSRDRPPLQLTVGTDHPRLPGVGTALVGLAAGTRTTVNVPAEQAYGRPDPTRVFRLARTRFPEGQALPVGKWVRLTDRRGRRRQVRILEVRPRTVVVDANHRWAGQALEVELELVDIHAPDADQGPSNPETN
jgi:FKBP-type peptidyl-prolyl cis-trans isomerase 2